MSAAPDAALEALFIPFDDGALRLPADARVLFLRARAGFRLREMALGKPWLCQQSFKPFAEALHDARLTVGEPWLDDRFPLVLVLPQRQREEARALFAEALRWLAPGGIVLAAVSNAEGARSAEADLAALAGPLQHLSKHKCRVFWSAPEAPVDHALQAHWLAAGAPRLNDAGYWSRPGLFAWDRIDRASALLAAQLPSDLAGRVADLGAGYGYLSCELLRRCPGITALDLYEAEARALEPAQRNLAQALAGRDAAVDWSLHWHDVTHGLPVRYDVIVSNPPFHQGRADLPELGRAFIASAADALEPHGRFWLVANRHLPYEAMLAERFAQVRPVLLQDGFKVIEARGVRG
ncbi:MAG: class I SAM-dependent methyltransferase [Dyella sp.]